MEVYFLVALILFTGVVSKQSKWVYRIGLVILFSITALRNPALGGTDAIIYQDFFHAIPPITQLAGYTSKYTIGYTLLNALVKQFTDNYIIFQCVYALISILLLHLVIHNMLLPYNEKCLFLFSYFCFRFIWNTWVIYRQNLANLLFWLLLIYFYKRMQKYQESNKSMAEKLGVLTLGCCTVVIPALFHSSAWTNVILFPLLLLFGKTGKMTRKILVPAASIAIFLFGDSLYELALSLLTSYVDTRYLMYSNRALGDLNIVNFILRLSFYTLFLWHYDTEQHPMKEMILDTMAFMVLIGSINVEIISRMYEYFAIGLYASMALLLRNFKYKSRIIVGGLFFLAMLLILARFALITDGGLYRHYTFWFQS